MKDLYKMTRLGGSRIKNYQTYKRINKKLLCAAKKMCNNRLIHDSNNKSNTVWGILKTIENKETSNITVINIDGATATYLFQVQEDFNFYFRNIPLKSDSKKVFDVGFTTGTHSGSFSFLPATSLDILYVIKNLNNYNSTSYDELSNNTITKAKLLIVKPLTYLREISPREEIFPSRLKISKIVPI